MKDKVQKIREEVARIQLFAQSEVLKEILDYIDEVQKEPVSEGLEVAAHRCYEPNETFMDGFKKGAKWQKQKDSIVSEDLEEASKEWLIPQLDKSYAAYGETKQMELTHFDGYAMLDAIEFGSQWQKEQMMKGCFIPDAKLIEFKLGESYSFDSKGFDKEKAKAYGAKEGDTIVAYFFVKKRRLRRFYQKK